MSSASELIHVPPTPLFLSHLRRLTPSVHTEVEAKGESDLLTQDQLSALVNKAELVKITDKHRPAGAWAFWYPEAEMDKTELETGQDVRLKTRGNSPFICESVLLLSCLHIFGFDKTKQKKNVRRVFVSNKA